MSLAGGHGDDAGHAALALVDEGLISIVASDAHGPTRPPALTIGEQAMKDRGVPVDVARALTRVGPRRLLARGMRPQKALAA